MMLAWDRQEKRNKNDMPINKIIKDCWAGFQKVKSLSFVIPNSIPILWFGDLEAYLKSNLRIITLGINPSDREFVLKYATTPSVRNRFPLASTIVGKKTMSPKEVPVYSGAMNSYFSNTDSSGNLTYYKAWFANYEAALNGLDASYLYHSLYNRTAIHVDLETPVATNKWSSLDYTQKMTLKMSLGYFFSDLLKELNPDVIITCLNKNAIKTFIDIHGNPCTVSNTCNHFSKKNRNGSEYTYIRSFLLHDFGGTLRNRILIWGNNGNVPFAYIKRSDVKGTFMKIKTHYHI